MRQIRVSALFIFFLLTSYSTLLAQIETNADKLLKVTKEGDLISARKILSEAAIGSSDQAAKALIVALRETYGKKIISEQGSMHLEFKGQSLGGANFPDPFGGQEKTSLEGISSSKRKEYIDIITLLLESGADPNKYFLKGYQPASTDRVLGSRSLVTHSTGDPGTIVDSRENNLSLLGLAIRENDKELIHLLTKYGAK